MKKFLFVFLLLCGGYILSADNSATQTQPSIREVGNLVLDGIPDIPERIASRMNQYQNVRSAILQDWDPTGNGILIATRFANTVQIHHVSKPGMYREQITFFNEPVSQALYPNTKQENGFMFSMDQGGGEFFQLYWYDTGNGTYRVLTDGGKSQNRSPIWSNQGKKLAFNSTKRNGKDYDIYLMDDVEAKSAKLIKEVTGYWGPSDWSLDDSQLLLQETVSANESYLYVLNTGNGQTSEVNSTGRSKKISYGVARFARDHKGIYYTSDEDSEFLRLTYYDPPTKEKKVLTPNVHWNVDDFDLSRDGKWIAMSINEGGISNVYLAQTSTPEKSQQIQIPKGVVSSLKFNPQCTLLGFNVSSAQSPNDVYSLELASMKVTRWTFSEVGGLNPTTFVSPELIEFSTFDTVLGKPASGATKEDPVRKIPAFYYKPRDNSKKPFPVIINIHGGPESQSLAAFSSLYQYWVNELGAAVLVPNVRGSDGYGKSYLQLDNGFKREDTVQDIGKLLDWIGTRPELDSKRVAVIGGSYGGYMVLSTMFHYSDRLKCGVDVVGISNFVTFLNSTEEYRQDLRRVEYGDERDPKMKEFLNSISPTTNASKIKIPLFIVAGKNDPRVPFTEAEQMVKAVRGNGQTVWYLLANDEGHGFKKKANSDFYQNAISLFLEENLIK
jgi:dipeptidyl aminopeptidase/acylaminoacyl peptidase